MGDNEFRGWVHEPGEGVGGGCITGKDALEPKIWRLEWPKKLRARMITPTNLGGGLEYKKSENGRKYSGMARVRRNRWYQKPLL